MLFVRFFGFDFFRGPGILNPVMINPLAVHWLSIGSLFHKISLSQDKKHIEIIKYKNNQALTNLSFHYRSDSLLSLLCGGTVNQSSLIQSCLC